MKTSGRLPAWITASLAIGAFLVLAWTERKRPLRSAREPKLRHEARNLVIAATGAVAAGLAETPVALAMLAAGERNQWGLTRVLALPFWLETLIAVLLMDYSMYIWHILMHRVPFFWRFHLPHHTDLDLDATTALRFHFGELLLSVPWRAGQIALIGVSPLAFSIWQTLFLLSIAFHHSSVRLPIGLERRLVWLIVTPRMHGIHHSIVRDETNSNWSSGLTIWDRLHRTLRLNVPQQEVTIGVAAYSEPSQVTISRTLTEPFTRLPTVWNLPGKGEPGRPASALPSDRLLA